MPKNDKPAFRFRSERTAEELSRRVQRSSSGFDSITNPAFPPFKPKEGENVIRILPPTWLSYNPDGSVVKDEAFRRWGCYWDIEMWVHYDVGSQKGQYLCLNKMKEERCPVCEAARNAVDKDEFKQFSPGVRSLCWIIDRNDEKGGPKVWSMPNGVYKEINSRSKIRKTGEMLKIDQIDLDDYSGHDITFMMQKTGSEAKNVGYTGVEVERDPTPLHDDQDVEDRWIKYIKAHPLPDVLQFYDADYIEKILTGQVEPEEVKEEEQEPVSIRNRSRRISESESEMEEEAQPVTGYLRSSKSEVDPAGGLGMRRTRRPVIVEEPKDEDGGGAEAGTFHGSKLTKRDAEDNNEEDEALNSRRNSRAPFDEDEEAVEGIEPPESVEKVSAQARQKLERLKQRHAR